MDSYNMFWSTQGNITQNIDKSHFAYETSMSINWKNKLARKVLINLIKTFNHPYILDYKLDGIAIWNLNILKNLTFYNKPLLFNEISLRDIYVVDNSNNFIQSYPFLNVNYKIELNDYNINNFNDYIMYDSIRNILTVKSRTIEENLVILDIFLNKKSKTQKDLIIMKNKIMKKMNKNEIYLKEQLRLLIDNLITSFNFNINIPKNITNSVEIIESESE